MRETGPFQEQLERHRIIGIDTVVFIYHLEAHPKYLPLTTSLLNSVQSGQIMGVISMITLMELTVRPWQLGEESVARYYEALLTSFPNLSLIAVNRDIARQAARLRATYGVRPADALQVATALVHGATAFVTNDLRLSKLSKRIDVILLDKILG